MSAGSRGDVAPYTGLGQALARAGHEVTLVTHGYFEPLVEGSLLRFHPLPVDPRAESRSAQGLGLHRSRTGVGKLVRLAAMARSLVGLMTDDLLAAARKADILLVSGSLAPVGRAIAEGLGLPVLGVYLQPVAPTREFAPSVMGARSWGGVGNRIAGHGLNLVMERGFAATMPSLRAQLGPARRTRVPLPVLHGFSPLVVPRPRDWPAGLEVAGYWWPYDREERLPAEVEAFLDAGDPPVYVGLGSATVPDPEALSAEIVRGLRRAGLRGVIQRGWGGLAADGDDMLTVDEVPHSVLFPRMAAVVHHAGAGTTGAGLRAGVPSVPVPVQFDAGFWARRLVTVGVAPCAVTLRDLTAAGLATALDRAVRGPGHRERARTLGARIRAEDGTAPVLAAVERLAEGGA